tara:strand:+ start:8539 stop:8874 length:336 start_codon:yes stop_codon:yes gene_type:complete
MELKGKLEQKLTVEKGTSKAGKEWSKQSIIINNGDQYNPNTSISFFGDDKVKMLNKFDVGQDVKVYINLSSKEYKGKWYNQIDGWKIDLLGSDIVNPELNNSDAESDDLPF